MKLTKYNEAIDAFDKAIEIKNDSSKAWYDKGLTLRELGKIEKEDEVKLTKYNETIDAFDKATEINPNYQDAWYFKGIALRELGEIEQENEVKLTKYNKAIEAFDKAIEIKNDSSKAWYDKGLTLRELGKIEKEDEVKLTKYNEAIDAFSKAIGFKNDYSDSWHFKGIALRELGEIEQENEVKLTKYNEAIEAFDKAIGIKNDSPEAWYDKGLTLRELGQIEKEDEVKLTKYNEAIDAFDKATKINPNYQDAWYLKGIALRELADNEKEYKVKFEKYDEAIKALDNAVDFGLDHIYVWYDKGLVCFYKGLALRDAGKYDEVIKNFDDAIDYLDKVVNSLNKEKQLLFYYSTLDLKGYILTQYGKYPKYKEAINLYNKLFKDNFFKGCEIENHAWNNIGLAYTCIGNYDEAIEYFKKSVNKSENDSYALCNEGIAYEKAGHFEDAINAYLTSKEKSEKEKSESQNSLINAYYYTGLACYNRGLNTKLADISYLENLPKLLSESELMSINKDRDIKILKNFYLSKSLEYFEKVLEIEPYHVNAWVHEARTLYELKRHKEAIDCLNEATKINANNGLLYTVLSNIYLDLGNLDDAYTSINAALEIGYENSAVWKLKGLIHIERKEYGDAIDYFNKAILFNAKMDCSIDPLFLLWKAYAKYLKIEFYFTSKDNIKYMECIHSIIKDLERAFLNEKGCIGECSLYFIGCFYYKINDLFSAKEKLKQCVELCETSEDQNKTLTPELLKVHTSACELLENIWTYQIKPPWWKWWLDYPVHSRNKKYTFYGLFSIILLMLFAPLIGSLYLIIGPVLPVSNNIYSVLSAGASNVSINWTLYLLAVLFLIFVLLFPCIERIKGKDFEIKMNSPQELKFELYPVTPPKKEPSPPAMEGALKVFDKST
ncbi:hypothetical protein MSMTP_1725 [Methanosarcina sp. MTP4]|uniref:tetratricopeptide repeat protein n=1 Tax=Methanosarcina sp. MTP4 TaxID=1434100 RepID=UPI000615B98E|nr:tetratricopeptide repeat protein [Methanosarcina sp. MTP4]AKB25194.1 hypothetical protein MSMTP_1725 [Methanosarcina sp. MTP4]